MHYTSLYKAETITCLHYKTLYKTKTILCLHYNTLYQTKTIIFLHYFCVNGIIFIKNKNATFSWFSHILIIFVEIILFQTLFRFAKSFIYEINNYTRNIIITYKMKVNCFSNLVSRNMFYISFYLVAFLIIFHFSIYWLYYIFKFSSIFHLSMSQLYFICQFNL